MPEVEQILWCELTGNKYTLALHPAMLSERGCIKQQRIRRVGEPRKDNYNVKYDRDYVMEVINRKICKSLWCLGKEGLLELVAEAWDVHNPNATQAGVTPIQSNA